MEKLRLWAQKTPLTFESWIVSFTAIVLVRTLIEQFSNADRARYALIDLPTLIHYGSFYLATALVLMSILLFFAKTAFKEVVTICLCGLLILWLPPIIDLLISGSGGHIMTYLFVPGTELLLRFFTFFGGHISLGITLGIQVEILFGLIFVYVYVKTATQNTFRSLISALTFYLILFILLSLPSIIALFFPNTFGVEQAFLQSIASSHIIINNIHLSFSGTNLALLDLGFNKVMTQMFTLIACIFAAVAFFLGFKEKFLAVFKNSRPERIIHFLLLVFLGISFAHVFSDGMWPHNWIDTQTLLLTCLAFISAWMFSVLQNDSEDVTIDTVSNKNRPLISGILSQYDVQFASKIFLLFSLLSAYAASHYTLFFVSLFILVYYIYSMPPLRLKRFVMLNSFLVSLACLSTICAGFFLVSGNKNITALPFGLVLALVVFFTAVTNIKDIKDIEGDRTAGITTLPTLFGKRKAQYIIGTLISVFMLVIPWYFWIPSLLISSIIAAVLSWYFITRKEYEEWKGFAVYMIYLVVIIITLMFT